MVNEGGAMIRKILVPIDGSDTARKALEYAADLAKQTGSTIILLSVIDKSPYFAAQTVSPVSTPTHLLENLEDYFSQAAKAYVAEAEGLCKTKDVTSHTLIKAGHPVEEIIKAAESSAVDLIVMGSNGKSALGAALLGSVTIGVMHKDTKFPVLVVRR
jgi:nucleotide-binding universal stress UspA family protein